jgi:hypothetical protein
MNRYPLRLSALAIGVALVVVTYSLVRPPAPRVAAHPAPTGQPTTLTIAGKKGSSTWEQASPITATAEASSVPTPTPAYAPPPVPTGQPTGMTVAAVYRRVQQAISRPGLLYHATIHFTARLGQGRKIVTQVGPSLRQWVDAGHDVAREEQNGRATLLTAQRNYLRQPDSTILQVDMTGPTTCDGATVAASAVLGVTFIGCPQPGTVVQRGRYAGRPAIVLVRGTATGTWLLYLDARTFLPLAEESTGLFSEVTPPQPLQEREVFTHAFIPVHAVPAHFFDPAAFRPEAPLNRAPRGFTIDWLGAHFAGRRHLPPLVLSRVEVTQRPSGPEFILFYSSADAFGPGWWGPALVTLVEEPLARWWRLPAGSKPPYGPCWAHRDITTPRGRARILLGFENAPGPGSKSCPAPPYNRFMAIAYLGQTVVFVDAPEAQAGSRTITNPYNTRQGIERVVRALQPRVPTPGATGSNK